MTTETTTKTKKKSTKKLVEKTKVRHTIDHELSDKEKLKYGCDAGQLEDTISKEEIVVGQLKEKLKNHNSTISELSTERRRILRVLETGFEKRETDCVRVKDFTKGEIRYMVGKKVIDVEKMVGGENQTTLQLKEKKVVKKKVDAKAVENKLKEEAMVFKKKATTTPAFPATATA